MDFFIANPIHAVIIFEKIDSALASKYIVKSVPSSSDFTDNLDI